MRLGGCSRNGMSTNELLADTGELGGNFCSDGRAALVLYSLSSHPGQQASIVQLEEGTTQQVEYQRTEVSEG